MMFGTQGKTLEEALGAIGRQIDEAGGVTYPDDRFSFAVVVEVRPPEAEWKYAASVLMDTGGGQ